MKNGRNLSLSRLLIHIGERLSFRPETEFAPSESEEGEERGRSASSLQPYFLRVKTALSTAAEESLILSVFRRGVRRIFTTRVRAFSVAFFLCGILQILSYFAGVRFPFLGGCAENVVFGAACLVISFAGLFVRGTVGEAILSGRLYSSFLKPYFGVEKWQIPTEMERDPTLPLLLAGLAEGLLSVWLGPVEALLYTLALAALVRILFSPESGLILCGIFLFVLPKSWFFVGVLWTLLSYFLKCAVGKRSLVFSRTDPVLLLALLFVIFAGRAWEGVCLFALYFSASGLLRSTATVKRLFRSLALGAFLWAGLFLAGELCEEFFPWARVLYPGLSRVFFVEGTLSDGTLFAMLLPLVMGFGGTVRGVSGKIFAFFALLFSVAALVFVRNGAVWLCALAGVVLWCLFSYRRALLTFVMLGLGLVSALPLLPYQASQRVLSFFGVKELLAVDGGAAISLPSVLGWPCLILSVLVLVTFLFECYRFAGESTATGIHPAVLGALGAVPVFVLSALQPVLPDLRCTFLVMILLALPRAAGRSAAREEVRLPY